MSASDDRSANISLAIGPSCWGCGKVALVTGSAKRIGKATVSALHKLGYKVVIHCNTSKVAADTFVAELNGTREDSAIVITADLSKDVIETCRRMISETVEKWGRLDLLVNNAACFFLTPLESVTDDHWNNLMDTNVKAPYFLSQAAAPHLKGTRGSIINIADINGDQGIVPSLSIYAMSKAALIVSSKSLAVELGPEVRVNYICPGAVSWPEHRSDSYKKEWLSLTPLGEVGTCENVADAVVFLASPASSYITGTGINVCGGRSLRL